MTQVVNNFITVQKGTVRLMSRTMQTSEAIQNESSGDMQQLTITRQGPTVANPSLRFQISLGTTVTKDITEANGWQQTLVKNVHKPLMEWNLEERNNGSSGQLQSKEKKKRVKLYSRRKVMYIAFFHAMKYMSLSEYEQIFILIKEKGKFKRE